MKKKAKMIDFQFNEDDRGSLVIIEESKNIFFTPKRLFYSYNVRDGKSRANHANIDSEFVIVAVHGSVEIIVDDGYNKEKFLLDDPKKGLYIPNLTWKSMNNFKDDAVILVIASTLYNKDEYINDYDEFIKYINQV